MVLHNNDLNQVTWEQRVMSGDPKFEGSQDIPDFPYSKYAELVGLKGILVNKPDDIGPAWDQAFASDKPVVIDVITDPNVPTITPHITFTEMKKYAETLLKGDPNEGGIIKQTFKDVVENILPH
jgi:pyruvate dehydrogenase (quinone)